MYDCGHSSDHWKATEPLGSANKWRFFPSGYVKRCLNYDSDSDRTATNSHRSICTTVEAESLLSVGVKCNTCFEEWEDKNFNTQWEDAWIAEEEYLNKMPDASRDDWFMAFEKARKKLYEEREAKKEEVKSAWLEFFIVDPAASYHGELGGWQQKELGDVHEKVEKKKN
jgi:hypothetical protein